MALLVGFGCSLWLWLSFVELSFLSSFGVFVWSGSFVLGEPALLWFQFLASYFWFGWVFCSFLSHGSLYPWVFHFFFHKFREMFLIKRKQKGREKKATALLPKYKNVPLPNIQTGYITIFPRPTNYLSMGLFPLLHFLA